MIEDAIAQFAAHGSAPECVIDGRRYTRHCAQEIHLVTFAVVLDSEGTEVDRVQIRSVPFTAPTKEHP